jgi:membrane-associated phospholipid phosphatase
MKLSAVAWGVALSASTVLTHQHHLPDILAAALLAGIIVLAAHKKGGQFTI